MVETFDSWIQALGQLGYLLIGLAALIEYLAPPFPGDTVVLLGGAWAVRSGNPLVLVLLAVTVASVVGIGCNYGVGRFVAARLATRPDGRFWFGVTQARVRAMQEQMRERGAWLLVVNRFLPTFRTMIFVAAGASHMPLRKVLGLGALSALLWNGMLLGVGMLVGGNAERLQALMGEYKRAAFMLVALAGLALLVRWLSSRKKAAA